jgi:hypothetical protein
MDLHEYTLEVVVRDRLAEIRAEAARWHQVETARPAAACGKPRACPDVSSIDRCPEGFALRGSPVSVAT